MTTAVILNRRSGSLVGGSTDPIEARVRDALSAYGIDADVTLAAGASIDRAVRDAVRRGASTVIVGGGDGTIRTAVRRLVGTGVTLGLLPLGTMDLLARNLGIPTDLDGALAVVASGQRRLIDLAFVNREPFAVMAMVGRMTAAALTRERQRSAPQVVRWTRTAAAAVALWRRHGSDTMRLGNGRDTARLKTPLVLVSRRRLVGGLTDPLAARAADGRGLLHAYAVPRGGGALVGLDGLLPAPRPGTGRGALDPWHVLQGRRLTLSTPRAYTLITLDGEIQAMRGPLVFSTLRRSLSVLAPPQPGRPPVGGAAP